MRRSRLGRTLTLAGALAAFAVTGLAGPAAHAGGGGCHGPTTEGTGTTVEMTGLCFTPSILHVEPGDTVTFTNLDEVDHPTHGRSGSASDTRFTLEGLPGESGTVRFAQAGTYPYACMLHPGMVGQVVVGDGAGEAVPVAAALAEAEEPGAASEPGGAGALQVGGAAVAGAVLALSGSFLVRRRGRPARQD